MGTFRQNWHFTCNTLRQNHNLDTKDTDTELKVRPSWIGYRPVENVRDILHMQFAKF